MKDSNRVLRDKLSEELRELAIRINKLDLFIEDPNTTLNNKEWDLLKRQFYSMKNYHTELSARYNYYLSVED